jgi:type IV pilus assembly protein PilA
MRKAREGFTLVELMIVVALVGVLAVLAVYGVRKYIANSKTAEARNSLGQISKDAATAYEKESMTIAGVLAQGSASATLRQLCTTSTPVPSSGTAPKGSKYQSSPGDWSADSATAGKGFACLKFSMDAPQYYAYTYTTSGSAAQGDSFTAQALGDLNGDGNSSTFTVAGSIGSGMVLNVSPTIAEQNPEE